MAVEALTRPEMVHGGPPEEQASIEAAAGSDEVSAVVLALTAETGEALRGGQVCSDRPALQALQNVVGWTIGGYGTRPVPDSVKTKERDRLNVLLRYRQPPLEEGKPPTVAMYDYLCDTLFGVPMRSVGPEVVQPRYLNLEGQEVEPDWMEADWEAFRQAQGDRPVPPVFQPNRYPYQLPVRDGAREEERTAQHWLLWYFHYPEEPLPDPPDGEIDADVRRCLTAALAERRLGARADYIWYRNPAMSVSEVFHVQVFWILSASGR